MCQFIFFLLENVTNLVTTKLWQINFDKRKVCHNFSFKVSLQNWYCNNLIFFSFVTIFFFFKFGHNFSFGVFFVPISVFEFGHNFSSWVLSQFEILSFVTTSVIEFCHNLSSWLFSQFEFSSCHNFSFGVLSQFGFLSCHNFRQKNLITNI